MRGGRQDRPAPLAPMTEDPRPVLNDAWLLRMQTAKPAFLRQLFGVFLAEEPGRLESLRRAVALGEMPQIRHLAHSLKGAAATMGAERLSEACRAVEFAARDENVTPLPQLLDLLGAEMELVFACMRQVLAGTDPN